MATEYSFEQDVTTPEEFDRVLGDLIDAALGNDIDIYGSRVYADGEVGSDVEVQFFQLESGDGDD